MTLEAKMNVMQAAFVILQSTISLDEDVETLSVGHSVFVTLFSSYFDKTDQEVKQNPACVCMFLRNHFCSSNNRIYLTVFISSLQIIFLALLL